MNLVIDIYGQNNVRTGGGSSSGNPVAPSRTYLGRTGPSKAKIDALWFDTRWRKTKGQGHFIKELRFAQKKGNKAAAKTKGIYKNKNTCFALQPGEGTEDPYLVQLPLLTRNAPKKKIPDNYKDDYLEFLRAYRCGFAYWLQTKAESTAQKDVDSAELFQSLLQRAANPESRSEGILFEDIVQDIYGKPFSGVVAETESLEKDFVQWLARR